MKRSLIKIILLIASMFLFGVSMQAQIIVGLDNWFNQETRSGKDFHYLWNDTTDSGYSQWGKIFTDKGAGLVTLKKPEAHELKKIQVYIIVDPDTTKENPTPNYILSDDIKAIAKWVKNGGVLIILANDAPNCEFSHLNKLTAKFGMVFNHVSLKPVKGKQWEMGAFTSLPTHPVFEGVNKIYMKEVSSLSLSGKAKPVLRDNNNIYMAECKFGKGIVFAVCDPWIYNEYIDHSRLTHDFENRKAAENLSAYLLKMVTLKKK